MFGNSTLALLLIVLCCGGCGDEGLCGNNQCLALLLIVLCCGGCGNSNSLGFTET
ncbi:MAG: hypothetical protein IKB56_07400 [Clostridia bacterium]|nr:hypothetical protein [Clostridia bacterium]